MKMRILLFVFFHLAHHVFTSSPTQNGPKVPAVIIFGDSIVDPGNNNVLKSIAKGNFPPYGQDFPGHKPTGRFSNGKIPGDFLGLGLKEFLPPYLGVDLKPEDILSGVSFASSACGYDPLTDVISGVIPMEDQLKLFDGEYKEKLRSVAGDERSAENIISNSLYIVCAGTDDFAVTYFTTPFRSSHYDVPSYVEFLVSSATAFLKKLYGSGAKKIGFVGLPPIGCLPSQRTAAGGLSRECVAVRNEAASLFNSRMQEEIQKLLIGMVNGTRIVFLDIYTSLLDIIQQPQTYGFEEATKGCCGSGKLEVALTCNSLTTTTCDDVSKFVFWDSFHPTEKAYKILTDKLFETYLPLLY